MPFRPSPSGISRYYLPSDPYFTKTVSMPLRNYAGYAEAFRRSGELGPNFSIETLWPMAPEYEYSPFGAAPCVEIRQDPYLANEVASRWHRAMVAMAATAVLGLGSSPVTKDEVLLAEMGDSIALGKVKFFGVSAGVSADPICIRSRLSEQQLKELRRLPQNRREEQARIWRALDFAEHVKAIACNFGFINVEDAQGKDLPLILGALECLRGECAVWSDDYQGTGTATAAFVLSWTEITGRKMEGIRVVLLGAGAGAAGVYDELLNHGVKSENILVTDSRGVLHEGRTDVEQDPYKRRMRQGIKPGVGVEEFAKGADGLINLGVKESLTDDLAWTESVTRSLRDDCFFLPMTNPEPGITAEMFYNMKPNGTYGSGKQTEENCVNNFKIFGYMGLGALIARAKGVGKGMTTAAARGSSRVSKLGPPEWLKRRLPDERHHFGRHWVVSHPMDTRLIEAEAGAVAKAAAREGLSLLVGDNPTTAELEKFDAYVDREIRFRTEFVQRQRQEAPEKGRKYFEIRFPDRYAPFTLREGEPPLYLIPPKVDRKEFEIVARRMAYKPERWEHFIDKTSGELDPKALTTLLNQLLPKSNDDSEEANVLRRELEVIVQIAQIAPPLGLALAGRRTRVNPEHNYLHGGPTVFHRQVIRDAVESIVPEARKAIYSFKGISESV